MPTFPPPLCIDPRSRAAKGGGGEAREQFPVEHDIPLEIARCGDHLQVRMLVSSTKTKTQRGSVMDSGTYFSKALTLLLDFDFRRI